jgi:hypothetical protein
MFAVEDLRACGLDLTGDPPVALVRIGDIEVEVHVTVADPAVSLRAELAFPGLRSGASLDSAALATTGDTAFSVGNDVLAGTRRLIAPSLGTLYDAVFELAKATCTASRLLRDIDDLDATAVPVKPSPAHEAPQPSAAAEPSPLAPKAPLPPAPAAPLPPPAPRAAPAPLPSVAPSPMPPAPLPPAPLPSVAPSPTPPPPLPSAAPAPPPPPAPLPSAAPAPPPPPAPAPSPSAVPAPPPPPAPAPSPSVAPTPPAPAPLPPAPWRATHRVGAQGAAAYTKPGDAQPAARLDPWLDVQLVEENASGWARVVCSNTWSTWIDRRMLQPMQ